MTKRMLELLSILVCVAGFVACGAGNKTPPVLTLEIPDAVWEPSFFQALEKRTNSVGMTSLRKTVLPEDDLEVRFWYDRFEVIAGVIIRRSGGSWSATYLRQTRDSKPSSAKLESLGTPKSGWETSWAKLMNAGMLTLPDGFATECSSGVLDGVSYVVETNVDRKYRTYWYGNPQRADCEQAKQMVSIENIIFDEFGLGSL